MMFKISYDVAERKMNRLTSGQIRAARALLRWRAEDLAKASMVGIATIRRAELRDVETGLTAPNDAALRRAFEAAGIEFSADEGAPGVRLRNPKRPGR
jgi:transcriptional regulator with XRE-family HTH domain